MKAFPHSISYAQYNSSTKLYIPAHYILLKQPNQTFSTMADWRKSDSEARKFPFEFTFPRGLGLSLIAFHTHLVKEKLQPDATKSDSAKFQQNVTGVVDK